MKKPLPNPTPAELSEQLTGFDSVFEPNNPVVTAQMMTAAAIQVTDAFNALTAAIAKMSEKP